MFSYIYCPHFSFQGRRGLFIIERVLVEVEEWGVVGRGMKWGNERTEEIRTEGSMDGAITVRAFLLLSGLLLHLL
jgi:hypothetical protein